MNLKYLSIASAITLALMGCQKQDAETDKVAEKTQAAEQADTKSQAYQPISTDRFGIYTDFTLTADLSHLSSNQKEMIAVLIDASKIMDQLFWQQAYGDKSELLSKISHEGAKAFADINYGPWDRLEGDKPFLTGVEEKPLGAQFYPEDMEKSEYEQWQKDNQAFLANNRDAELYSMVERNDKGELTLVPYNVKYKASLEKAAQLLKQASELADNKEFKNYLKMRAEALLSNQYQPSDFAWMDMKTNPVELVLGPIETYEDQLFGYRSAFESYVLIKDLQWSERLAKFAAFLPELQQGLPVSEEYKQEMPGTDADLNAYDVVYYAGHSNAGSKTIAINLPNDEEVQLAKGTRRLQLKNAMRAKFDKILVPISQLLIADEQQQFITFDAFFANTMFHEVAHGLGIKNTINDKGMVRTALKETASALEEGKADILGLYMITELFNKGEITEGKLMDNYVTFLAGIFRSVRFGASSAHGKANMIRFNYFKEKGAFEKDSATGKFRINFDKMTTAMNDLSKLLLTLQGNGDYEGAKQLLASKGVITDELQSELDKLTEANIPVDIVFNQGKKYLDLK
ncbi:dipeptidyl-peptidase 3 family protein [Pleionea mediterranea]|uniref:Peptidase M49-like protein n=1 Tax=Pleionea mediterranea TaxID=523701 RepID=A0A316FX03_9GAMM|nr:Zn-dependent hydrolase [Pleionea mediterranea]PWK53344.1 peptidase M49-like protein [Pleionea mediterranea]